MIGIGTPSSQSRIPRPMIVSSSFLRRLLAKASLTDEFSRGLIPLDRYEHRHKLGRPIWRYLVAARTAAMTVRSRPYWSSMAKLPPSSSGMLVSISKSHPLPIGAIRQREAHDVEWAFITRSIVASSPRWRMPSPGPGRRSACRSICCPLRPIPVLHFGAVGVDPGDVLDAEFLVESPVRNRLRRRIGYSWRSAVSFCTKRISDLALVRRSPSRPS